MKTLTFPDLTAFEKDVEKAIAEHKAADPSDLKKLVVLNARINMAKAILKHLQNQQSGVEKNFKLFTKAVDHQNNLKKQREDAIQLTAKRIKAEMEKMGILSNTN